MSYKELQNENIMLYKVVSKQAEKLAKIKKEIENLIPAEITFKELYYLKKYLLEVLEKKG